MQRKYPLVAAAVASLAATVVTVPGAWSPSAAATTAKSEYVAALAAAMAQNVHYVSKETERGRSIEVVGDTGTTSGSKVLAVQSGATTEDLAVVLVGARGYLRGNVAALEKIIGLTAQQSLAYAKKWLSFPKKNAVLSELVSGLRDADVASELQMTGPYKLEGTKKVAGLDTRAIEGSAATSSGTKVPILLYVASSGTPHPVEEVTNPEAKESSVEGTVTFSRWGEATHPKTPSTSIPLLPLLPAA